MTSDLVATGAAALAGGRWSTARDAFARALEDDESGAASYGLAVACWWLGENQDAVSAAMRAYGAFRREGDVEGAVQCAAWLCITYKANFANFAAANGWIERADRLLESTDVGPLHALVWLSRAYQMTDLAEAAELTTRALAVAESSGDVDTEVVARSQLGRIRVAMGDLTTGFAMIDEAMAAALGGERSSLDTVAYTCCDMLNACEEAADLERAAQWCQVADEFIERYGCPFLYAECRTIYGTVLVADGRWDDADRELADVLRITVGTCPGLHAKALTRLGDLRIRQGRWEEARQLLVGLDHQVHADAHARRTRAALLLATGDAAGAARVLEAMQDDLDSSAPALELLVETHLETGDPDHAADTATRLERLSASTKTDVAAACAASARGRVALAAGDVALAATRFEHALTIWSRLGRPFELARTRFERSRALADSSRDEAVDEARLALRAFEALGATADADRVASFLREHGEPGRSGPKRGTRLTAREEEVLHLLGLGLSNPELADRLHVSRKTAAHHVSSILTKLDLRNRAEAAAYATRHGDRRGSERA